MSAPKRAKTSHYRDRIPLEDDYEVIHARSAHLTSRNMPTDSARSPMKGRTSWTFGNLWAPDDDEELALDETDEMYNAEVAADIFVSIATPLDRHLKRKRRVRSHISVRKVVLSLPYMPSHFLTQTRPHVHWKNHFRSEYLDEDIRWEGRGDFMRDSKCPDCLARARGTPSLAEYRCLDCFTPDLVCRECCVKRHQRHPFHLIEVGVA